MRPNIPSKTRSGMLDSCIYGIYNAACAEFYNHEFMSINQLRVFCKVKPALDETLDQKRGVIGYDLPGRMVVRMAEENLKGIFRLENREMCSSFLNKSRPSSPDD